MTSKQDDELRGLISDKLSEHSIHPQETHVEGCSYEEDETTCSCSYSFEFKQYPLWLEEMVALIRSRERAPEKRGYNTGWQKANRNQGGKRFKAAASELQDLADRFNRLAELKAQLEKLK